MGSVEGVMATSFLPASPRSPLTNNSCMPAAGFVSVAPFPVDAQLRGAQASGARAAVSDC